MSYTTLLKQKNVNKELIEKYYNKRVAEIGRAVDSFFSLKEKKALEREKAKIQTKKRRTYTRRLSQETIKYRSALQSLKKGLAVVKTKPESVAKLKTKAYKHFQAYCRLLRADREGFVRLLDTNQRVHWKKSQGGHYFSKHNHPQLGFEPINCRPISPMTNKLQGDQPGYYWRDALIAKIGQEMFDQLEGITKQNDDQIRDRKYWEDAHQARKVRFESLKAERERKEWIV